MKLTFRAGLAFLLFAVGASAQPTVFTYQGQLQSGGSPATGNYDLRFTIYDALTAGSQVGGAITNAPVGVTNGLFTTTLDFGSSPFNGSARWLDLGVRTNGSTNQYTFLAPRQPLSATPYAIRALNAQNLIGTLPASSVTGVLAVSNLPPTVALLNSNANFSVSVSANQFSGSGAGLSNLPAASLTGLVADARLSTNVAFLSSNAIFKANIVGSNFFGNGIGLTNVPGRIFEVISTAANIQALANFGYLATNDLTPVVVTLPLSANIRVGETVRVAGSGAGGWRVAQNAGQSILMGNLLNVVGLTWTPRASSLNWKAVAASADGKKLAASASPGGIHTSTDYGVNWTPRGGPAALCIASSWDGVKLVAGVSGGQIYTSTDSGVNWFPRDSNRSWSSVASSLDGTKLVASVSGIGTGAIYTSIDSGATWGGSLGLADFSSAASSADGVRLVATHKGGMIYTSANSGATWSPHDSNRSWVSVASSSDGSRLVAAVSGGALYISTDYGTNWLATGPTPLTWTAVAASADGVRLAAVYNAGGIHISSDSGLTWAPRNLSGVTAWMGVAMSSDASTVAAVGTASQIYMSSQAATMTGTAGYLTGARLAAVELEYVGGGVFIPVSYIGNVRAN